VKRKKEVGKNDEFIHLQKISPTVNKNGANSPTFHKVDKFTHSSSRFHPPQRVFLVKRGLGGSAKKQRGDRKE
jgi:hypothetical protein